MKKKHFIILFKRIMLYIFIYVTDIAVSKSEKSVVIKISLRFKYFDKRDNII